MNLNFKKLMTAGLVALGIGIVLFSVGFIASDFSFDKMTGTRWENKTYTETADVTSISVDIDSADITIKYDANAENISIAYSECIGRSEKAVKTFNITESGGKLTLKEKTNWLYHIRLWSYGNAKVEITVPADRVLAIELSADTGDVEIIGNGNTAIDNLVIDTDNGGTEIQGIATAGNITLETDNGDFEINGNLTAQSLSIEIDNGDVDIVGTLNISGVFSIDIDNGDVDAEDAVIAAEKIYLTADNGDIEVKLFGSVTDYKISAKTDNGKTNVNDSLVGERELYVKTDNGDVYVYFSND